ncbi:hypothetical protein [Mycolicibacterium vanbaalenii]|uniref:hypothetical protein n=1 Tax=Mycolicibacterium vanbaalenii TaxID=110539 RepID=UPI00307DAEB6
MRTPRALVRRSAAVLAAGSAALHGASLGPAVSPWVSALTVVMLVGCLYCAYELWTRDTVRAWVLVAAMNLVMVGVHLPMSGAHHHGAAPGSLPVAATSPMHLASAVALIEVLLAGTVLFVRTRALAPVVTARSQTPCQSGDHDARGRTRRPAGRDLDRLPGSG